MNKSQNYNQMKTINKNYYFSLELYKIKYFNFNNLQIVVFDKHVEF